MGINQSFVSYEISTAKAQPVFNLFAIFSYGKFLLKHGKFAEAAERLKIARDVFVQVRGRYDPDYVNILNDVAVACLHVRHLMSKLPKIII